MPKHNIHTSYVYTAKLRNSHRVKKLAAYSISFSLTFNPLVVAADQIITSGRTQTSLQVNGSVTDVRTNTIRGNNGFNSFNKFDVYSGKTVNLHLPAQTDNLINLVHGQRSYIDGVLNSVKNGQIGGNVFFANPFGVVVGDTGRVNVGSINISTPTQTFLDKFFDSTGAVSDLAAQQLMNGQIPVSSDGLISIKGKVNAIDNIELLAQTINVEGGLQSGAIFDNKLADFSDVVNTNNLVKGSAIVITNGEIEIIAAGDSVASITTNGAVIGSGDVTLSASAAGNDLLNIVAVDSAVANINVSDTEIVAGNGNISITAEAKTDATAEGTPVDMAVDAAIVDITSNAGVSVSNSLLDASHDISLSSSSALKSKSIANASTKSGDATADAAFALTNIDSKSTVSVENGSSLTSGNNTHLTSITDINATTTADGSSGGDSAVGATVAIATIDSTTAVSLNDSVATDVAGTLGISASSSEVLTTKVTSTAGGASDNSEKTKAELNKEGRKAETSDGGVNVAAALAVTDYTSSTTAKLNVDAAKTLKAGVVDVTSSSERTIETEANASATGGDTGVGVAVGITVADITTQAEVDNNAKIETAQLAIKALKGTAASTIKTSAVSGAGASNVGVAGALATSVVNNKSEAVIRDSAIVNMGALGGSVTLSSESDIETTVSAKSTQDGDAGVGVGASAAVNVGVNDTLAEIEDGVDLTGAKDISLQANSAYKAETEAEAGSAGGVSVTPVVGLTVTVNNTSARLGSGNKLTQTGEFSAKALHKGSSTTKTSADAAGDKAAVGASMALTVATDTVNAITDRDMDAQGSITFEASSDVASATTAKASAKGGEKADDDGKAKDDKDVNKKIEDQVAFGDKKSGKTTEKKADASTTEENGGVSVAAAVGVNIGVSNTTAMIPEDRKIKSGDQLTVRSKNTTDASVTADGSQVAGESTDVGVGAAVAVNVAAVTNRASIEDNAAITAKGLTVEAIMVDDSTSDFGASATSGAGSSKVGVAGALATHIAINKIEALVKNAVITLTGGDVTLTAQNNTSSTVTGKAVQKGSGDVGVGASVAVNIGVNDTKAEIEDGAELLGAKNASLQASSDHKAETEAEAGSAGGVSVTPVVGLTVVANNTQARLGSGNKLTQTGEFSAKALHKANSTTKTSADAAGDKAAVGASMAVTVATDTVNAVTDRDMDAQGSITFEASSDVASATTAKASAKGGEKADDDGKAKDGKDVNKKIDEQVAFGDKKSGKTTEKKADASTSEGGVSVAAAIGVNIGVSSTTAMIPEGRAITSGDQVIVRSKNTTDASATADGTQVAGESTDVGVGAAVAVNVAAVTNRASIENNATITANGLTVEALMVDDGTSDFGASATSGAGSSKVGVAGALATHVGVTAIEALVKNAVIKLTGGDATLTAQNNTSSKVTGKAVQKGSGDVGVGASVAVNVGVNDTKAEIEDDATLIDGNKLSLTATSLHDMSTTAEAGSAGGVALTPVAAVTVGINETTARVGTGSVLSLASDTSITSEGKGSVTTSAKGQAEGDVAVGVAIAVAVSQNNVNASLARGGRIDGTLGVTATSGLTVDTDAVASAKGASDDKEKNGGSSNELVSKWKGSATPEGKTTPDAPKAEVESSDDIADSTTSEGETKKTDDKTGKDKKKTEVQVAGAIGASIIGNDSTAKIADGVVLTQVGDTSITSSNDVNFSTLASGTAVSDQNGVGAAVALTVADNDSAAVIGKNVRMDKAGDISISSETSQNMGKDFKSKIATEAIAGASGGKVAVAGAAAILTTTNSSKAYIDNDTQIDSSGDIQVQAVDQSKLSTRAWAGALSKDKESKAGVGAAFAVLYAGDETLAYVGSDVTLLDIASLLVTAENKKVDVGDFEFKFDYAENKFKDPTGSEEFSYDDLSPLNVLSSNNYYTEAAGGAASTSDSGVAFAGAFSIQVLNNKTQAYIDDQTTVTSLGPVEVSAKRDTNAVALGGAFGGSKKVGVGVTVANINVLDATSAYIGKHAEVTTTGNSNADVSVSADTDQVLGTVALSGAVAAGGNGAAINGVLGAIVSSKTTEARIDSDAVIKSQGSVGVNAANNSEAYMLSGGVSAAGKAAVGGSLAAHVNLDKTTAEIGDRGIVDAKHNSVVTADADNKAVTLVIAGGAGGKVGVVGAASVNTILTTTEASIGKQAKINTDANYDNSAQNVIVDATDDSTVVGISGAIAGGGTAGVGAAIDTAVFNKDVHATIDSGAQVEAGNHISVKADSAESATSISAGFAGGGKAGVGGAVSVLISTNDVSAVIADDIVDDTTNAKTIVEAKGNVQVEAIDDFVGFVLAGSGAGGGTAGVGGSLAATTILNVTKAIIGGNAEVTADKNITVTADMSEALTTLVVGGAGGGTAGVAATVSATIIKTITEAVIGRGAKVKSGLATKIQAEDDTTLVGVAGAAAGGGTAGVGAGVDTGIILKNTSAYIDEGASVDALAGDIDLKAVSKELHTSNALGFAGGGSVGVGGSIATSVMANNTKAYTVGDAKLSARDNITIAAQDDATVVALAGAGSGGGAAGVAGSLAVAVNSNTTSAHTGSGSELNANKSINIEADSTENVISTVVTGSGGGSAGVAGSIGVKVINTTTEAYLGAGSKVNQQAGYGGAEQALNVSASDRVISVGVAGSGAGGGAAGVGAGADVTIVRNTTTAYVGDGSVVDVDGVASIAASSDKYVNSFSGAGAGGGAAGVAGAASVISVGALLDKQSQSGLSGEDDNGNSGSVQSYADQQTSGSLMGDMLGSSDRSTDTKALFDEETAKISVSDDFDKTTGVALNRTQAFVGSEATLNVGKNLDVTAEDKTLAILATAAGAGGGAAGVAGAIGVVLLHESAEAFIANKAKVNVGESTRIAANTKDDAFVSALTGSGAGAAAVNGVALVTVVNSDTSAYIADEAELNQDIAGGDSVSVEADSTTNIIGLGGSGGGAGAAAVGGVAGVVVIDKSTKAFIAEDTNVRATDTIAVLAKSAEQLISGAIAIFGAGAAAVNGVASAVVIDNETEASIANRANIDSDGNVKLEAVDDTLLVTIAGSGSGAGAAGVTGAVSVNTITNKTRATIGDSAVVNARGNAAGLDVYTGELGSADTSLASGAWDDGRMIDIDGDGVADVKEVNKTPDMDSDGMADGDVSNGAEFSIKSEGESAADDADDKPSVAGVGIGTKKTANRKGLSITALSNEKVTNVVAGVAGAGAAAVAGTAVVNVVATETHATIGDNAVINQSKAGLDQSVQLSATDNTELTQIGGTLAGAGAAGVSGSANTAIVTKDTAAKVGSGVLINAGGNVDVLVSSIDKLNLITANVSAAGAAGVGGAVGVATVSNGTRATAGSNLRIDANNNFNIDAASNSDVLVDTISGAGGGVAGVSGAVSVAVITNDTESSVGSDSELDVANVMSVTADSKESAETNTASAAGGGIAGVAGAVSVKVVSGSTTASLGDRVKVNQGTAADKSTQSINVAATDTVALTGFGGSAAVGTVGVGASADINIVRNSLDARVGGLSTLKAANDINVEAIADKNVDSTTVAAAGGGAVGVGGATSITVIGAALDSDSQDSLKDSEGSGSNTASFVDGKLTEDQASEDMGDSEHIQASKSDLASRTAALNVSSDMNAVAAADKTLAYVGTGTTLDAGNNVNVKATDYTTATTKTGGTAVGAVGVGGAVGVTTVTNNTEAVVADNAILKANNALTIAAKNTQRSGENTTVDAFGGAAGLVGVGAAVAYIDTNNRVIAKTGNYVNISDTNTVNVTAEQGDDIDAEAIGAAAGAGAVGASLSRASRSGEVEASLGNNNQVNSNVDNLNITAVSTGSVKAKTIAGAAGTAFAGSGAFALANDNSTITAKTGRDNVIGLTDVMSIIAAAVPQVSAESIGVSVAGGVKIGASVADAQSIQGIAAYTGANNNIVANYLNLTAIHNRNGSHDSTKANVVGAGGGLLLGLNATEGNAKSDITLNSYVGDNATLMVGQELNVKATNSSKQRVDVTGVNGGIIAAGFNKADAESDSNVNAYISDNAGIAAGTLTVNATSLDNNFAGSVAGSGGLVSGSASEANTDTNSITQAYIGDGIAGKSINVDSIDIDAQHTSVFNATVDSTNASLVGASGATATNKSNATVNAGFGSALNVKTDSVDVDATNVTRKSISGWNVTSGSGGIVDLPAASSTSTIVNNTTVAVGSDSQIVQTGDRKAPGLFAFDASNDVTAVDKVKMNAGGAVALAKGVSTINANTNNASVDIGEDVALEALGDLDMGAKASANVSTTVAVDVYGLAGAPIGASTSSFKADNQINIGENARLIALQDIRLGAGIDTQQVENNITSAARTDLWNNTAIPINVDPVADAIIKTNNAISIAVDATVKAVRNIILKTEQGQTSVSGVGIGKDIYREALAAAASEVSEAFGGDSVSFDIHGGSESNSSINQVTIDGDVSVGIQSKLKLEIDEDGNVTRWVNDVITSDPSEGIQFTKDRINVAQDIRDRISDLQGLIAEYKSDSTDSDAAIAVGAYEAEIVFLEQKLVELGYSNSEDGGGFSGSGKTELELAKGTLNVNSYERQVNVEKKTGYEADNSALTNANTLLGTENGQLAGENSTLAQEVSALESKRDALDPNANGYAADYAALQGQIESKNNQISSNETTIYNNSQSISGNNDQIAINDGLISGHEGEIATIDAESATIQSKIAAGEYDNSAPAGPTADLIEVADTTAQLGNIYVTADTLSGSGLLKAPGDAEIIIENQSRAFIKLNDLIVPANEGGRLYFNDVDVSTNAEIANINAAGIAKNLAGLSTLPTANFGIQTAEEGVVPTIRVSSAYNPLLASNLAKKKNDPNYLNIGPDIILSAGTPNDITHISNTRGSVVVESAAGNIRLEENTLVSGASVEVVAQNGDFIQSYTDAFSHVVGGEPLTFVPADPEIENSTSSISKNTQEGTSSGIIANGSVLLAARYLNINGTVQSGIPEWGVRIAEGATVNIEGVAGGQSFEAARAHYSTLSDADKAKEGAGFYSINGATVEGLSGNQQGDWVGITVEYNAIDDHLSLSGVEVKGGYIQIYGQVFNTNGSEVAGGGSLRVLDGYGQIKVDNQSSQALFLNTLDAGQGVEGKIKITNVIGQKDGELLVEENTYTRGAGQSRKGQYYDPDAYLGSGKHLQYSMTNGTDSSTKETYLYKENSWFDSSALSNGEILASKKTDYQKLSDDPLSQGEFLTAATNTSYGADGVKLTSSEETTSQSIVKGESWADCNWWTLCANADHYQEYIVTTGKKKVNNYSIDAGNSIAIEYIGFDEGKIDVASNGDILIAGDINNRNGATTLTSRNGQIVQVTDFGSVSGIDIVLNAAEGIGSLGQGIDISGLDGGLLSAVTGQGDIHIVQATGDMNLQRVSASNGKVLLDADGSITGSGSATHVKGKRIELISHNGGIGAAFDNPLNLETGSTTNSTQFADYGLEAKARDSIHLKNTGGDLMVVGVESLAGDVTIETDGAIIDNNQVERTDTRAFDQLVKIWDDMQLRGDSAVIKAQDEILVMEESITAEYRRYWATRAAQAGIALSDYGSNEDYIAALNASTYDAAYRVELSAEQESVMRDQLTARGLDAAATDDAIVSYIDERTNEYHAQHARLYDTSSDNAVQGVVASGYDESFRYQAADVEKSDRTSGSSWSDFQLALSVSAGLLKEITDTVSVIEEPNVKGKNVVLMAGTDIGSVKSVDIDLNKAVKDFTLEEKAALAAAERGDVTVAANKLTIMQPDDVDVEHSFDGSLAAFASAGDAYLGSEKDIRVQQILAANEIRLKVSGALHNGNDKLGVLGANIVSQRAILEAAHGAIGSADKAMLVNLGDNSPITARAANDIYLTEYDGDMDVDTLFSRKNIYLTADGSIVDAYDSDELNIRADSIVLTAGDSVGENDNALEIGLNTTGEVTVDALGSVHLASPVAALNINNINALGDVVVTAGATGIKAKRITSDVGDIRMTSAGSIAIESATGGISSQLGAVTINSGGDVIDSDDADDNILISALNIMINSTSGSVGEASNHLRIDTLSRAANQFSAATGISVTEVMGDMAIAQAQSTDGLVSLVSADGNIELGAVAAGEGVSLMAKGSVLDGNGDAVNIDAKTVTIVAENGAIGRVTDSIELAGVDAKLTATAPGDIAIAQTEGNLLLDNITSSLGDVVLTAKQSILNDSAAGTVNVVGNEVELTAQNGSIGAQTKAVKVNTAFSDQGQLTASAANDIYIEETDGAMDIANMSIGRSAGLVADGDVLASDLSANAGDINVQSNNGSIIVSTINVAGNAELDATNIELGQAVIEGAARLNSAGKLTIDTIQSQKQLSLISVGDLLVSEASSILEGLTATSSGTVNIENISVNTAATVVAANDLTIGSTSAKSIDFESQNGDIANGMAQAERVRMAAAGDVNAADLQVADSVDLEGDNIKADITHTGGSPAILINATGYQNTLASTIDLNVSAANETQFDKFYTANGDVTTTSARLSVADGWVTQKASFTTPQTDVLVKNTDKGLETVDVQIYAEGDRFNLLIDDNYVSTDQYVVDFVPTHRVSNILGENQSLISQAEDAEAAVSAQIAAALRNAGVTSGLVGQSFVSYFLDQPMVNGMDISATASGPNDEHCALHPETIECNELKDETFVDIR